MNPRFSKLLVVFSYTLKILLETSKRVLMEEIKNLILEKCKYEKYRVNFGNENVVGHRYHFKPKTFLVLLRI